VASRGGFVIAWGVPIAALIFGSRLGIQEIIVTPAALTWMGAACLLNARGCSRLHCFITGPYFLLLAAVSLLHGFEIVPLGAGGWRGIGVATLVGGVALWVLPERIWGKYIART
jgi:hypothetical protein